ncbi:MAG TPA: hypothetical protein VGB28_00165 [Actinomycetota bacterium]|jgi:hypothetical protein
MADAEKDMSFKSELGISRRDLLRRGAIAGGTLLWAAPVIQSLRTPAFAQTVPACGCCCCVEEGAFGGQVGRCRLNGALTESECREACTDFGGMADHCTNAGGTGNCFSNGTNCSCGDD